MTSLGLQLGNHEGVERAIDLAVAAEEAGLDTVWIAEDLFYYGAIPIAAAILSRTTRLRVGFGVLTPYGRHPAFLAMDIATLQRLAGDRLIVGLGAGVRARIEHMGYEWQNPVATVREIVDLTTRLLRGETLDHEGNLAKAHGLALTMPEPPGDPVVYVAAMGPKALAQAGRLYEGVLFSSMVSRSAVGQSCELVIAGASEAGRSAPPDMVASLPMRIAENSASAVANVKRAISVTMLRWSKVPALRKVFLDTVSVAELEAIIAALEGGEDPASAIDDAFALTYTLAGTVSDVVAQIRSLSAATGITSVAMTPDPQAEIPAIREQLAELRIALAA